MSVLLLTYIVDITSFTKAFLSFLVVSKNNYVIAGDKVN